MKVQYFGDVNDFRKFALLRLLAEVGGFKIGVCWMMTEPDDTKQGQNRSYLGCPSDWRHFDEKVFDALKPVPPIPKREDLRRVEGEALIPSGTYFETMLPDNKTQRTEWHAHCLSAFSGAELGFFDPDNGLEIAARQRGRKNSNKYAFVDELADHYRAGRSVLVYQHYPRLRPRAEVVANASERLTRAMPGATTQVFATPFAAFILASAPQHATRIAACRTEMDRRRWSPRFFAIDSTAATPND